MTNVDFNLLINRKSQPTKNNNPTNKKTKLRQYNMEAHTGH